MPNPNNIKRALITAVIRLTHTCSRTTLWLYQHPQVLEPDIQVKEIIVQEVTDKLLAWGYTSEDFYFTSEYVLVTTENTRQSLLSSSPSFQDEPIFALIRVLLMMKNNHL